jgi:serine/threonine protein kinase
VGSCTCRFFHSLKAYNRESGIVAHPRLRTAVPPVFQATENLDPKAAEGILEAPNGYKFPPFIIMERGCSLADWQQRQPLTFASAINMMYEVARLLQTVHGVGRAHRDVQPENVMLMAQSQAWKLSDFGVAASIGVLPALVHTFWSSLWDAD